ncbi:MAG TPA: hypothetical protein VEB22_12995 [Phycisphaerales bacterium]|nr:hypothetical protein [Phycisphaerales bacterium]
MELSDGPVRKKRRTYDIPGHAHELTFSCYHSRPYLRSERACRWMVSAVEQARRTHGLQLWAFVFMPTHVHLLLFRPPRDGPLGVPAVLKSIKQSVSKRASAWVRANTPERLKTFEVDNGKGGRAFRFWQDGGGYDRNIYTPQAAWHSIRYIHWNPVEMGLCDRPEDWRWSSARWFAKRDDAVLACDPRPVRMDAR